MIKLTQLTQQLLSTALLPDPETFFVLLDKEKTCSPAPMSNCIMLTPAPILLVTSPLFPLLTVTEPPLELKLATNTLSETMSQPAGLAPQLSVSSHEETPLR